MSYFGIPIRNGLPIGLGSLTAFAAAINSIFSPSSLFAAGEQGVWYDPSDLTTLFQDSAGTTPVTAVGQPVGKMLDKSGRGNHATQTTSTKRPVLSARYNLLTKTEQFDDAYWYKNNVTEISDVISAPNSTLTADALVLINTGTLVNNLYYFGQVFVNTPPTIVGPNKLSCFVKAGSCDSVTIIANFTGFVREVNFNLILGTYTYTTGTSANTTVEMISKGNNWWYCSVLPSGMQSFSGTGNVNIQCRSTTTSTIGSQGIYLWGASLVPADQASLPYQRVNTATDYDTVGFKQYEKFDAVDDQLDTTFSTSLGSNCTVARAVPGVGVAILTGQTIGTSYASTLNSAGQVIVNRALTGAETANLTTYLNKKAGV